MISSRLKSSSSSHSSILQQQQQQQQQQQNRLSSSSSHSNNNSTSSIPRSTHDLNINHPSSVQPPPDSSSSSSSNDPNAVLIACEYQPQLSSDSSLTTSANNNSNMNQNSDTNMQKYANLPPVEPEHGWEQYMEHVVGSVMKEIESEWQQQVTVTHRTLALNCLPVTSHHIIHHHGKNETGWWM